MDIDDELRATHAIRTVLTRYCRGVDRMDADLITSCWHEGGTCDYGVGIHVGTPPTFVEWLWPVHFAMESHSHQVTNVTVTFDGLRARSEAYVTVVLRHHSGDQAFDTTSRGRYLDTW